MKLAEFLESQPPGRSLVVDDLVQFTSQAQSGLIPILNTPEIMQHCNSDVCNGNRIFRIENNQVGRLLPRTGFYFMQYRCSNCKKSLKVFSVAAKIPKTAVQDKDITGEIEKFGEMPVFGPRIQSKLVSLIGGDREEFLKGRRCESQGLGVAAFIYYRRVVESQKNRILEKIKRVAQSLEGHEEFVKIIDAAIKETQFSKALEMTKDAVPESLLIRGHSPLALLHDALSDGVHARSDEECLDMAESTRIILSELSDRLHMALKDDNEVKEALSRMLAIKSQRGKLMNDGTEQSNDTET